MDSFRSKSTLKVGSKSYEIYRLDALDKQGVSTRHLPFSLRIRLENLLRTEDGRNVNREGNCVYPQPGADAGLYRRPCRR